MSQKAITTEQFPEGFYHCLTSLWKPPKQDNAFSPSWKSPRGGNRGGILAKWKFGVLAIVLFDIKLKIGNHHKVKENAIWTKVFLIMALGWCIIKEKTYNTFTRKGW